jgi:ubiquinone/menaquinone biosynthesis C-methylase UbiE
MAMDPANISSLFDARAPHYAHDDWHRRYAEQLVAVVPLRPGDVVLDAGTGTGFAACAIAQRVGSTGRVIGVDLSRGMLEQAQHTLQARRFEHVELLQADVTELSHHDSGAFDAVVCSAGLLYMPVAKALREWHRLLKPQGIVAFSTMRAGSPSAGRVFRECAAEFGVVLHDPSEPLGTEERCRDALEQAGFDVVNVTAAAVNFGVLDLDAAWEANFGSAKHAAARSLDPRQQAELRHRYVEALQRALDADRAGSSRADALFAIGRRP